MNSDRFNYIQNTESHLLGPLENKNKNPHIDKKEKFADHDGNHPLLLLNKELIKNSLDLQPHKFQNLNKLEQMIALNEQNHHLKDFLFEIQHKKIDSKGLKDDDIHIYNNHHNNLGHVTHDQSNKKIKRGIFNSKKYIYVFINENPKMFS